MPSSVVRQVLGFIRAHGRKSRVAALGAIFAMLGSGSNALGPNTFLVGVGETTGSGSEDMTYFGRGFGDLLITDLVQLRYEDPRFKDCDMAILEWRRRADLIKEFELQQSRYIDPNSVTMHTMPPEPTALIEGNLTEANGSISWSIALRDRTSGKVMATSQGDVPLKDLWDVSGKVALAMMEAACPQGWDASGGGANIKVTGHVAHLDKPFQLTGEFPGATATFDYAPTGDSGGNVTYTLAGSGVTGAGSGTFTLAAQDGGVYRIEQTTKGCVNGVPNSCRSNSETITLTPVAK